MISKLFSKKPEKKNDVPPPRKSRFVESTSPPELGKADCEMLERMGYGSLYPRKRT